MERKHWVFGVVVAVVVLGIAETTAYLVGRSLVKPERLFYVPQDTAGYLQYLEDRDPVLGWPAPSSLGRKGFDASGSRPTPAFPEPGNACVSLYGDSMTYSDEVGDTEAWGNVLSLRLGCRVANYGVRGYGTDQAFLRFQQNTDDEAPVVVLGHLTDDVMRNVNQFRDLISASPFSLKPRFVLDEGGRLQLVPLPRFTAADFEQLVLDPDRFLPYEYFGLEDPPVVQRLRFPYLISVLSTFDHFRVRAALARRPAHAEFYRPDHPAQGLQITTAILERFVRIARERGKQSLTLVIPIVPDLEHHARTGQWSYQPLLDALAEAGIDALNIGDGILAALEPGRDLCDLFGQCRGHLNAEGYALLARLVHDELVRRDLISPLAPQRSARR